MTAVTCMLRIDDVNPGHARVSVFVGRTPGARGHAGQIVLRTDELVDLLALDHRAAFQGTALQLGRQFEVDVTNLSESGREVTA